MPLRDPAAPARRRVGLRVASQLSRRFRDGSSVPSWVTRLRYQGLERRTRNRPDCNRRRGDQNYCYDFDHTLSEQPGQRAPWHGARQPGPRDPPRQCPWPGHRTGRESRPPRPVMPETGHPTGGHPRGTPRRSESTRRTGVGAASRWVTSTRSCRCCPPGSATPSRGAAMHRGYPAVGPERQGAGSMPAACKISQTVWLK